MYTLKAKKKLSKATRKIYVTEEITTEQIAVDVAARLFPLVAVSDTISGL